MKYYILLVIFTIHSLAFSHKNIDSRIEKIQQDLMLLDKNTVTKDIIMQKISRLKCLFDAYEEKHQNNKKYSLYEDPTVQSLFKTTQQIAQLTQHLKKRDQQIVREFLNVL
jgi:cob(I)alamin adenosyltransferase